MEDKIRGEDLVGELVALRATVTFLLQAMAVMAEGDQRETLAAFRFRIRETIEKGSQIAVPGYDAADIRKRALQRVDAICRDAAMTR